MSLFRRKLTKSYWWNGASNFGDAMAPFLLERFSGIKVEWGTISHSSVASIGSILEHIPPLWDGHIIGSGKMFETSRLCTASAKIWALRGPLSARGIKGDFALGDPGILADELVGFQNKQWDLGLVPHWQDRRLHLNPRRFCPAPLTYRIIRVDQPPLDVIRQIGACKNIVTSSLHGTIVADAFGIPRRVESCKAVEKDGGHFKFRDYSQSIHTPFVLGKMQQPSRGRVEDVRFEIYDAYRYFGDHVRVR